jgi:OFA family oxalate/formate antiporter-like MFS transporter
MDRKAPWSKSAVLGASCVSIFWPGAFIFALPGILGPYWQDHLHVGRAAIGSSLFFVLSGVGVFMFITGRCQEKYGPRPLVFLGAIICGFSTILVGHSRSIEWIYVWAFMMGVSSSLVYIPTLTVVQKWYPAKRGLVSGLVNMSFGFSAAVMSPLFSWSLARLGVAAMTLLFGLFALIIGLLSAGFIRSPQEQRLGASGPLGSPSPDVSPRESLRTSAFWLIWLTWAFAGAGGISMVTLSTSFGLARGLTLGEAILILTAFNVTNGLSRLLSGYLSDRVGRNLTMTIAFLGAGAAYLLLDWVHHLWAWAILSSVVGFAFGTLFAVSGPLISDCFGLKHFGTIFGLIFTAYGFFSGALGPWLSGHILDYTEGNFKVIFFYLGSGYLLAALLIWFARPGRH